MKPYCHQLRIRTIDEVKYQEAYQALVQTQNNKTLAARLLGVSLRSLRQWCIKEPMLRRFMRGPKGD